MTAIAKTKKATTERYAELLAAVLPKPIETAAAHDVWVISDECYLQFVSAPRQPFSAAALPAALRERVLIAGSLSKTYGMTGWRIGYTVGLRAWVNEVIKVQSHSATHASSIAQRAAAAALTGPQTCVAEMLSEYQRRAAWLIPARNEIPGAQCGQPEGAFYAFPDVTGWLRACGFASSKELADELLWKRGGVTTDGEVRELYASRFWIEEMFSDHKSRGLNLESTRLTAPKRLERLLVAVTLAWLWIMEVGAWVVLHNKWRQVDNRGAERSVSLCQIGLRWLTERQNEGFLPPLFSGCFKPLETT